MTTAAFSSGSTSAIDLVDAEPRGDRLRRCVRLSPVSMTMRMPSARSAASAAAALSLIGSATASRPAALAVDRDQHDALAVARAARRRAPASAAGSMPSAASSAALPTATRLPSTVPATPLPVSRAEVGRRGEREAARLGAGDDRGGERVLAAALEAGGEAQQLVLGDAAERR